MSYLDAADLPTEVRSLVQAELRPDERLVWVQQPIPKRLARSMLPIVLFAIPWTAFALFWMAAAGWGVVQGKEVGPLKWLFPLFGLPFVLIGVAMLSSPYWVRRGAKRSAYVLTDQRAITLKAGLRGTVTVRSFEPERLTDLQRKQHADGSGDLIFTQDLSRDSDGHRQTTAVGFLAIPNVKQVEDLVRAMVASHRTAEEH